MSLDFNVRLSLFYSSLRRCLCLVSLYSTDFPNLFILHPLPLGVSPSALHAWFVVCVSGPELPSGDENTRPRSQPRALVCNIYRYIYINFSLNPASTDALGFIPRCRPIRDTLQHLLVVHDLHLHIITFFSARLLTIYFFIHEFFLSFFFS